MKKVFLLFLFALFVLILLPFVNGGTIINITSPVSDQINNRIVFINISYSPDNATILYNYNGTNLTYNGSIYKTIDYGITKLIVYGNDTPTGLNSVSREFNIRLEYKNGLSLVLGLITLTIVFLILSFVFVPKTEEANGILIYAFKSFFIIMTLGSSIALLSVAKKLIEYEFEEKLISNVLTSLITFTTWIMIFLLIYFVIWYLTFMIQGFYKKFVKKEDEKKI